MDLVEYVGLPYAPQNALHAFDAYIPTHLLHLPHRPYPLVCFIHGGAWRSEDKAAHAALARSIAISTGHPVAVPNYRLTPTQPTPHNVLHHPEHAMDVLRFLEFVASWHKGNGGPLPQEPSSLCLIGHSCAAHMLCTLFLRMPGDSDTVCPSDALVQSTAAIIMSEGIYDIDLLLSSFPSYRAWFIENTFGRKDSFENVSAIRAAVYPKAQHIRWLIIHSKGDTLIDERQSGAMYDFLRQNSCLVSRSFDDLEDEHDDVLKSTRYLDIIYSHINDVVGAESIH